MTAEQFFGTYAQQGSPCHYGGAYDNYFMRGDGRFNIGSGEAASPAQLDQLAADIEEQVHQGWIGASLLARVLARASPTTRSSAQAAVAAKYGAALLLPRPLLDRRSSRRQRQDVAGDHRRRRARPERRSTSCTSRRPAERSRCRRRSTRSSRRATAALDVTACLYPYNFWATYIQSARFNDGMAAALPHRLLRPRHPGNRRAADRGDDSTSCGARARTQLVAAYAIPEPDVVTGLQSPMTMIGSDAILTPGDNNHPRGAGCFSRALGHYVREQQTLSLVDALAKMTILPAKRLEAKAPALQKKGRLQRGADADITIFDPNTVADRATVDDPSQPAAGIDYVLVLGTMVLSPDGPDKTKLPGQPIKSCSDSNAASQLRSRARTGGALRRTRRRECQRTRARRARRGPATCRTPRLRAACRSARRAAAAALRAGRDSIERVHEVLRPLRGRVRWTT